MRGEFTDFRISERREVNDHRVSSCWILNVLENLIALVLRVPLDEALGSQQLLAVLGDFDMDMGSPSGV
jgi:hypothetical protein